MNKYYILDTNRIDFGYDTETTQASCTATWEKISMKLEFYDDSFTLFKVASDVFSYLSAYKGEVMSKQEFAKMLDGFGYVKE